MSSSIETLVNREYRYGFVTDIEADIAPPDTYPEELRKDYREQRREADEEKAEGEE